MAARKKREEAGAASRSQVIFQRVSTKQAIRFSGRLFRFNFPRIMAGSVAQATVVTAHAIARVVHRMLKYKVEYETISVEEYEKENQPSS